MASGLSPKPREWLDRHEVLGLSCLVALYLAIVLAQARLKLIWADELITFYIAKQPGFDGIWQALRAGADPNPPLTHVLVKMSTAVLGDNTLGMRLPAILSVLLALLGMWSILRAWVRPASALAGVLAFMATRGFDYAYDARSYGPLMGFAMMSLGCWMAAARHSGGRRWIALTGMTFALALGVSSNYYGVLAFFPIAAGEVTSRRIRWETWVALALGGLPLIAFLPLIRHNIAEFGPHAWNRPRFSMVGLSYFELVEGVFWPVAALAVYGLWKHRSEVLQSVSRAEVAALTTLLLYPFLGFALAVLGAGLISPRCVAPVCCGFGLAAGLLAQRVFGQSARMALAIVLLLGVWVVVRESICASLLWQQRQAFARVRSTIEHTAEPIVLVADSSLVLPLFYYSQEALRARIVVPVDFDAIHRYEQDDSGEQNLWAGRRGVFPFPIVSVAALPGAPDTVPPDAGEAVAALSSHADILVIARPDGWLFHALVGRGFVLADSNDGTTWSHLGGVFTPMAHAETRLLNATRTLKSH